MSQIVTFLTDQRLQLQNSQYVRAMTWGTNWTEVRISLRASVLAPRVAASLGFYGYLAFGVCSGYTNAIGDASTDAFMGLWMGDQWRNNADWKYNASPSGFWTHGNGAWQWATKKEGTTFTQTNIAFDQSSVLASKETSRGLVMIQITKGDPNYTFKRWTMSLADAEADSTAETQIAQLIAPIPDPSLFVTYGNPVTIAKPTLVPDHVNMYWSNQVWPVEISDLYLVKNS